MIIAAFLRDYVFKTCRMCDKEFPNARTSEAFALKLRSGRVGCSRGFTKSRGAEDQRRRKQKPEQKSRSSPATVREPESKQQEQQHLSTGAGAKHEQQQEQKEESDGPEEPE